MLMLPCLLPLHFGLSRPRSSATFHHRSTRDDEAAICERTVPSHERPRSVSPHRRSGTFRRASLRMKLVEFGTKADGRRFQVTRCVGFEEAEDAPVGNALTSTYCRSDTRLIAAWFRLRWSSSSCRICACSVFVRLHAIRIFGARSSIFSGLTFGTDTAQKPHTFQQNGSLRRGSLLLPRSLQRWSCCGSQGSRRWSWPGRPRWHRPRRPLGAAGVALSSIPPPPSPLGVPTHRPKGMGHGRPRRHRCRGCTRVVSVVGDECRRCGGECRGAW